MPTSDKITLNNRSLYLIILIYFTALITISIIRPPMASPDETHHFARAYTLSNGEFMSKNYSNLMTGGYVDAELLKFTNTFFTLFTGINTPYADLNSSNHKWSSNLIFFENPGASYYFPILYFPSVIAITTGRFFDLTIKNSYHLACLLTIIFNTTLILLSIKICDKVILLIPILCTPMSLFQLSSPTLDGPTFSITILSLAIYFKIITAPILSIKMLSLLSLLITITSITRVNLSPMLLLIIHATSQGGKKINKSTILLYLLPTLIIFLWYYFSISVTNDLRVSRPNSNLETISHYTLHPYFFMSKFFNTITNTSNLEFYAKSYLGILGWLNIPLPSYSYLLISIFMILYFIFISHASKPLYSENIYLFISSFISFLLIFLALDINWTHLQSSTIEGVQGRYFIPSSLLFISAFINSTSNQKFLHLFTYAATYIITLILISTFFIIYALLNYHG